MNAKKTPQKRFCAVTDGIQAERKDEMAYLKQNFKSGQVLTAAQMNYIENGIENNGAEIEKLKTQSGNSVGSVTSVNNKTGDVVLTAEDVGGVSKTEFQSTIADLNNDFNGKNEETKTIANDATSRVENVEVEVSSLKSDLDKLESGLIQASSKSELISRFADLSVQKTYSVYLYNACVRELMDGYSGDAVGFASKNGTELIYLGLLLGGDTLVYGYLTISDGVFTFNRTYSELDYERLVNLVESDEYKAEIAEMVDGATIVQAPIHVNSVDKMTDTSKVYVLAETGHIWAYMDTTTEQEVIVRDDITSGYERGRLSNGGANSGDVQTHTLTPFIDLTKAEYQGKTIQLHLEGNRYISEDTETYVMSALFNANKIALLGRGYSMQASGGAFDAFDGETVEIHNDTSATLTIPIPLTHKGTGSTIAYMRFCGLGTVDGTVYITYPDIQTVTGGQWVDTGTTYAPTLTEEDKQAMVDEVAEMVDTQLLTLVGDGVVTV